MSSDSTILIVDDERVGRDTLEALLFREGYSLVFAKDGEQALAKAAEFMPDLVLLDVMMPGIDGFEVCRRLRADPLLAEVPIVMVTALDDRESRLLGITAGADDFVSKPFDREELRARVQTITRLNRYRQLVTANRQLEDKIARLSGLYEISSALNSAVDIDALLGTIIQKTNKLLNVEGTSLLLWDQERDELYFPVVVAAERNQVENKLKQVHFSSNMGIAGWVLHECESAIVHDVTMDERFYSEVDRTTGFVTRSVLCVPLRSRNHTLGVLEAVNKKDGKFTEDHQLLLEAIADNAVIAIEEANLHRELERAEAFLRRQNAELRQAVKRKYSFENIIGKSDKIVDVLKKAEQVALTDSTVLIYGETGTGKELVARAIHQSSPRSLRRFVPINCGAIPENLLESELFGHEKGAFTSATAQRIGRFEEADDGTVFLDEIGDMPLNLQVRLLRVLQEGVIQRLGSNSDISVDVRVIVATHQNLWQLVEEGKFRRDLYYRLKVFELEVPPLRERKEDIPLLIDHFIRLYNEEFGKQIPGIEDAALDILCNYDYPGNVRELGHIIESAMILCRDGKLTVASLPKEMQISAVEKVVVGQEYISIPRSDEGLKAAKAQIERLFLEELLLSTSGNVSEAARRAGMNRSWLSRLVTKHQLDPNQFQ